MGGIFAIGGRVPIGDKIPIAGAFPMEGKPRPCPTGVLKPVAASDMRVELSGCIFPKETNRLA